MMLAVRNKRLKALERRLRKTKLLRIFPRKRLQDFSNPLEKYDGKEFKERFHVFKETALFVVKCIDNDLKSPIRRGVSIPPIVQLCVALRYYASGSFQIVLADLVNVTQSTVSVIITRVSKAIAKLRPRFIKYPTFGEAADVSQGFYQIGKFPGVVGCVDGTHVQINAPGGEDSELFRNRKQVFSINVQGVCDHNLNFTNIVAKWYGSAHDMRIFDNSLINCQLEEGKIPGLLLGDAGYACLPHLMTPLSTPKSASELKYQKAQLTTRNTIERTFGIWKRRFPCMRYCRLKLKNVLIVIVATAVLHNISRRRNDIFDSDGVFDNHSHEEDNSSKESVSTGSGKSKQREIIEKHFS